MYAPTEVNVRTWGLFTGIACLFLLVSPQVFAVAGAQPPAIMMQDDAPEIPPVVAIVEGEEITGEEFQQAMMAAMQMKASRSAADPNRDPNAPPAPFGREDAEIVLQNLIRNKVVLVLAKKAETQVTDAELDEVFADTRGQFSEEEFEQLLAARGLTEEVLKGKLREQLLVQKFVEEKTKDVAVPEEELVAMYEELKAAGRMEKPETADVSHILIMAPRDGSEEDIAAAKVRIDAARERIVEGKEDFGEVAKEVSEDPGSKARGGLYEDVPRGQMVPEFDQRTFDLPIGEVSEPFLTQFGWHILEVERRDEAGTAEYGEVKDRIRDFLEGQAKSRMFSEYLESALEELDIEILLPKRDEGEDALPDEPA